MPSLSLPVLLRVFLALGYSVLVVDPIAHHPLLRQVQELAEAEEEAGEADLDPGKPTARNATNFQFIFFSSA